MIPQAEDPLADIEGFLSRHEQKELVRFTTVGSVDDGKSTLIGRLLHDTGSVYDDQLRAVTKASKARGAQEEIDFSLFTDGLLAEREQGITIDVAYRYFATEARKFIIADTPGHVEYTRNMATGASTADIAIILIDARLGVLPQSRRHAAVASLLGIGSVIVAINKMDLANYEEKVFRSLEAEFSAFLSKLNFKVTRFVPVSAKAGDNVVHRSDRTPWYTAGTTLLELLETLPRSQEHAGARFRFPVQTVLRPNLNYRAFAGWITSGSVKPGDRVVVLPSMTESTVASIETFDGPLAEARAPLSVSLRLADEVDVSRGQMIAHAGDAPSVASHVEASVVWLSERAFDPSRRLLMKHTSRWVPAVISDIKGTLSLETLEVIAGERAIRVNDLARVEIALSRPIFCDPYRENRQTGAFVLVDALSNATVAAGMIERPLETVRNRETDPVTARERSLMLGHRAALVDLGPSQAVSATQVERALFDQGISALAVDAEMATAVVVRALLAAGVVVLVHDVADAVVRTVASQYDGLQFLDLRAAEGDRARRIREWVTGADGQLAGSGI